MAAGYAQNRPDLQNTRKGAENEKRHRRRLLASIIGGVLVVGIAVLIIAGVAFKATGIEPTLVKASPVSGTPTYSDINVNPTLYFGRTVSVTATVTQLVAPRAYVLGGFDHGEPILVLDASASPRKISYGQMVTVTGKYQQLHLRRIEQQTGVHFDSTALEYYTQRPTIVVTSGS